MVAVGQRVDVEVGDRDIKPGNVIEILADGSIAVRLDGEGKRVDVWHAERVREVG